MEQGEKIVFLIMASMSLLSLIFNFKGLILVLKVCNFRRAIDVIGLITTTIFFLTPLGLFAFIWDKIKEK